MAGPALGGVLVGAFGAGAVVRARRRQLRRSAVALLLMRPAGRRARRGRGGSVLGDLREGWRFVRERRWLWVTFVSAAVAYLLFMGPVEVLVPYVVKHDLRRSASDLGLDLRRRRPRLDPDRRGPRAHRTPSRNMTFMYVAWTVATLAVAGYGIGTAVWQLMLASATFNALETAGTMVWVTAKQRTSRRTCSAASRVSTG